MIIGLINDIPPENRTALLPVHVKQLRDLKAELLIEKEAGKQACVEEKEYESQGGKPADKKEVLETSDIIIQVGKPTDETVSAIKKDKVWISEFDPLRNIDIVNAFKEQGVTSFSMDSIPRITRAQSMDVLSSMASVSGYKAVLDAASHLPTFFPMFMSAAGTIRPANVLVLGAGVAGLQAIAIARKLGAQVEAFDVRSAVKEEVMSLGAKFVEVEGAREDKAAGGYAVEQTEEYKRKQQEAINQHAKKSNVVICTAQIPGKKAPLLISKEVVEEMQTGSVIIDLAASSGGNCELSENNKKVVKHGVTIIGQSNYPSLMPKDASLMFGKNVTNFLKLLIGPEGNLTLNFEDEIVKGTCITHQGEITNERVKSLIQ